MNCKATTTSTYSTIYVELNYFSDDQLGEWATKQTCNLRVFYTTFRINIMKSNSPLDKQQKEYRLLTTGLNTKGVWIKAEWMSGKQSGYIWAAHQTLWRMQCVSLQRGIFADSVIVVIIISFSSGSVNKPLLLLL